MLNATAEDLDPVLLKLRITKNQNFLSKIVDAGPNIWYNVFAPHHSHTERVCIMNSIAYDIENEKTASAKISQFFQRFHIGEILRKCNA